MNDSQNTHPPYLYHYTSQKGLLGILQSNKLLMTNILYLNDSSEHRHTLDLLITEVEKRGKLLPPPKGLLSSKITQEDDIINKTHDTFKLLKMFRDSDFNRKNKFKCYVFSLSKKDDDLSQWRSYCPREGGFSIGFDYKRLSSIIKKNNKGYTIQECEYDPVEKQKLIRSLLDYIHPGFEKHKNISPRSVSVNILIKTIFFSSFIKDTSFKDEQEYRIINNGTNFGKLNHCEGKSMIIPYIEFSPVDDDNKLPISRIIVGPTPHPELSKSSVLSLLKSENYEGVDVEISNIPYRSW